MRDVGGAKGFDNIICGSNFDDMDDFRPGNRAAEVGGVRSPLMEAGMTKADIRDMSRELGLPCVIGTNKATRVIKSGKPVTVDCSQGEEGYHGG